MNAATASVPIAARRSDLWFDDLPRLLEKAVADFDFENSDDFQSLADLSAATQLEGIDVDGDSAVVSKSGWTAPAAVYVTLVYDPNSDDPVELNDSYPATVHFRVSDGAVAVERIDPNTRSFYE
jgi:Predicted pPIWI-associating nuclease